MTKIVIDRDMTGTPWRIEAYIGDEWVEDCDAMITRYAYRADAKSAIADMAEEWGGHEYRIVREPAGDEETSR